ncbi:hypothetical protein H2248_001809 [Termitomyces sp. 'cryptogamus']|nr:hypothetical protein H2248_001809 [Termitomyces sp. 'cryptogamus']
MTSADDPVHDEINLVRLVRRLERDTPDQPAKDITLETWIKAQGTLQKVKFARRLLKNVELYGEDQSPKKMQHLSDIRIKLEKIETHFKSIEKPQPARLPSILSRISRPARPPTASSSNPLSIPLEDESLSIPTDDLLLPADTPSYPSSTSFSFPTPMTLIPTTIPSSTDPSTSTSTAVTTGAAPRLGFLQNPNAIQEELFDQISQMATQLKRNTVHFSELLTKDKAVVEETKEKLESNFDVMQKERLRLRDHRGKSWGTTWLSVLVMVTVLLLFVIMVGIIRFT